MGKNVPNYAPTSERPLSMLDAQPPLPNVAPVRLVEHEDEDKQERDLVLVMPYVKEMQYGQTEESQEWMRNPLMTFSNGQFRIDLNNLMFIANQARLPAAKCPK